MTNVVILSEDRAPLRTTFDTLENAGFQLCVTQDRQTAIREISRRKPELVLLDCGPAETSGFETLREIRRTTDAPVVLLSEAGDDIEEILAFREGADDYIRKPCMPRLLLERARSILRRLQRARATVEATADRKSVIDRGALHMDPVRHEASWNGQEVTLTRTEFTLLLALAEHPGHVKSREQLMDYAYGQDIYVADRTVDSHIKRLRKKIRGVDPKFSAIDTVYGIGYRFRTEQETEQAKQSNTPLMFRQTRDLPAFA